MVRKTDLKSGNIPVQVIVAILKKSTVRDSVREGLAEKWDIQQDLNKEGKPGMGRWREEVQSLKQDTVSVCKEQNDTQGSSPS